MSFSLWLLVLCGSLRCVDGFIEDTHDIGVGGVEVVVVCHA